MRHDDILTSLLLQFLFHCISPRTLRHWCLAVHVQLVGQIAKILIDFIANNRDWLTLQSDWLIGIVTYSQLVKLNNKSLLVNSNINKS